MHRVKLFTDSVRLLVVEHDVHLKKTHSRLLRCCVSYMTYTLIYTRSNLRSHNIFYANCVMVKGSNMMYIIYISYAFTNCRCNKI